MNEKVDSPPPTLSVAIKVPIPEKASALTREEIEYLRNEINIMTYAPFTLQNGFKAASDEHLFLISQLEPQFRQNQLASQSHLVLGRLHGSEQVQDSPRTHGRRP